MSNCGYFVMNLHIKVGVQLRYIFFIKWFKYHTPQTNDINCSYAPLDGQITLWPHLHIKIVQSPISTPSPQPIYFVLLIPCKLKRVHTYIVIVILWKYNNCQKPKYLLFKTTFLVGGLFHHIMSQNWIKCKPEINSGSM